MQCVERLREYSNWDLDTIILKIRNGSIKSGKYAHLVKIDKDFKIKKHLFDEEGGESNGQSNNHR